MGITVRELASTPDFRTRVLAGASGLDREIGWAHVCELPDPTEWLGKDELLMTVGFSIPEGPDAQEALVERLVAARLSGLLICDQAYAPAVTHEMLAAADRLSLPILLTAYEVPFSVISRTIGEANRSAEHARLLQVLRVYETVRLAANGASGVKLFEQLGHLLECEFFVLDPRSGVSILAEGPRVPEEIAAALTEEMKRRSGPMPAILRLQATPQPAAALLVSTSRPAALVAASRTESLPDLSVLHHITGIAALEVERLVAEYERKRRLGSELLAALIDGRVGADSAAHLLSEWNLSAEPKVVACCTGEGGPGEHSDLHLRLGDRGVPHLLLRRAPVLAALLPNRPKEIDDFRREIDADFPIGLSGPIGTVSRLPDAYREAQWALQAARSANKPVSRYGDDALSPFLPRNLSETDRAVRQILGPLLDYDATHGSQLVLSLRGFLAHNRSWQRAASELHVHKQTLVYRMKRVEALTGRQLDQTEDVAELWFAIRAAEASSMTL